jgi:hypothetical protein
MKKLSAKVCKHENCRRSLMKPHSMCRRRVDTGVPKYICAREIEWAPAQVIEVKKTIARQNRTHGGREIFIPLK